MTEKWRPPYVRIYDKLLGEETVDKIAADIFNKAFNTAMKNRIDVLDHGYVRLVSFTQPVPLDGETTFSPSKVIDPNWTGDLEIVRAARTSYDADWRTGDDEGKDAKLLHRLWTNGHTSPFEAMSFSFEVQAPIFVFRQWHRHRTQSYSEVSARYTELPDIFYVPDVSRLGEQSKTNKQGTGEALPEDLAILCMQEIRRSNAMAYEQYKQLLRGGLSRELARMVLPVNTYSRMYASANLLNWFRFLNLRLDSHAQYEIRVYAEQILAMIERVCPVSVAAFKANPIPGVMVKVP